MSHRFQPGTPKPPGSGRKKGQPNRLSVAAKEAFQLAFDGIGGAQALTEWAMKHRREFYRLYARLIPANVSVSGSLSISDDLRKARERVEALRQDE